MGAGVDIVEAGGDTVSQSRRVQENQLTTEDTEDTESNIVSRLGFSLTFWKGELLRADDDFVGGGGSRKFMPRDWLDLTVSGRFSDESSIFLFQDPVV